MFADNSENANPKPCAERRKIGFLGLGAVCVYIKLMEHGQEGKQEVNLFYLIAQRKRDGV